MKFIYDAYTISQSDFLRENMEMTLEEALVRGSKAKRRGQFRQAEQYYYSILNVAPTHPEANYQLALLAVIASRWPEAFLHFETAIEVSPNVSQYWMWLVPPKAPFLPCSPAYTFTRN